MGIIDVQHRMRELGRIRLGEKGPKGQPQKLSTFRLTSPSELLLKHASGRWGGIPQPWEGAPGEGAQYELVTETDELEVYVPQQDVGNRQLLELYTKGGVQRRCDGEVELMSGKPCLCDPSERACSPTTHVVFILPQIPDVGVWRLTTHGWNAAAELPGTVDLLVGLAAEGALPAATLVLETRTSVVDGKTMHYPVPVLRVPYSLAELQQGGIPVLQGGTVMGKPALDAGGRGELPADASFTTGAPLGEQPALPPSGGGDMVSAESAEPLSSVGHETSPPAGGAGVQPDPPAPPNPPRAKRAARSKAKGAAAPVDGEATVPVAAPDAEYDPRQDEAFKMLVSMCNGKLARAATYVNKACHTGYTSRSIGKATVEELEAGMREVEK